MKTKTIQIPFEINLDTDSNGFSFASDTRLSVSCYASEAKATKTLRDGIAREVDEALNNRANGTHKRAIGTKQGEVFIVEYRLNSWWYSIVGPGRSYAGSCGGNWKSIDEVLVDARQHAGSGFGGIAWECSY